MIVVLRYHTLRSLPSLPFTAAHVYLRACGALNKKRYQLVGSAKRKRCPSVPDILHCAKTVQDRLIVLQVECGLDISFGTTFEPHAPILTPKQWARIGGYNLDIEIMAKRWQIEQNFISQIAMILRFYVSRIHPQYNYFGVFGVLSGVTIRQIPSVGGWALLSTFDVLNKVELVGNKSTGVSAVERVSVSVIESGIN